MKAISLQNPWAQLVVSGFKTIEAKTWTTDYRGELLICSKARSDKSLEKAVLDVIEEETDLVFEQDEFFVNGAVLGKVTLMDVRELTEEDLEESWMDPAELEEAQTPLYAWVFDNAEPIAEPVAVKGKSRLYDVELPADTVFVSFDDEDEIEYEKEI